MQNIKNRLLNSSTQEVPKVSKENIIKAFKDVGVIPSDIVLIHSSLKSFGTVQGMSGKHVDGYFASLW